MGSRSTLDRLPKDLADLLHKLIREGRTIIEITNKLNELDAEVSKSAVGRYVKSAREQMQRYRDAQAVAGQWVSQLGEQADGDVGALLAELLKSVAFQTMFTLNQDPDRAAKSKPMDLMLLAKAVRDIEATSKQRIERALTERRAVLELAKDKVAEVGKREGLTQAKIDIIQKELGLL